MAQNVTIAGASYSDVPAVDIPKTGGGTAVFVDSSDANATASDILSGKTAYVDGVKVTGNYSPSPTLETVTKNYTSNGSDTFTPGSGYDGIGRVNVTVNVPQGVPIEISTDAGMTAVLVSANVGKVYKFTGTTGTYTNGDLYIVEVS